MITVLKKYLVHTWAVYAVSDNHCFYLIRNKHGKCSWKASEEIEDASNMVVCSNKDEIMSIAAQYKRSVPSCCTSYEFCKGYLTVENGRLWHDGESHFSKSI